MKSIKAIALTALMSLFAFNANAALVKFTATGSPDVSGYVVFDDSSFTGSTADFVSNTAITDLSLTVLGYNFSFADVISSAQTIIDSSGALDIVTNGAGGLAFNGTQTIAFFPDGWAGTAPDGDASLTLDLDGNFDYGGAGWEHTFAVKWEASAVPEPSTWVLMGLALVGVGFAARRRQKA